MYSLPKSGHGKGLKIAKKGSATNFSWKDSCKNLRGGSYDWELEA